MSDDIFDLPTKGSISDVFQDLEEGKASVPAAKSSTMVATIEPNKSFRDGRIGDVVTRFPISRVKFSEEHPEFVVPFTEDVFFVRYHFFAGLGYVYCANGVCCANDKIPPIRAIVPVFRLSKSGADCRYILLTEDDYNGFVEKWKERETLVGRLVKIRCTDAQYQKIDIDVLEKMPLVNHRELWENLVAYYQANKQSIRPSIARIISNEDLAEALGVDIDSNEEGDAFFS